MHTLKFEIWENYYFYKKKKYIFHMILLFILPIVFGEIVLEKTLKPIQHHNYYYLNIKKKNKINEKIKNKNRNLEFSGYLRGSTSDTLSVHSFKMDRPLFSLPIK